MPSPLEQNEKPGRCWHCGETVLARKGLISMDGAKLKTAHLACVEKHRRDAENRKAKRGA